MGGYDYPQGDVRHRRHRRPGPSRRLDRAPSSGERSTAGRLRYPLLAAGSRRQAPRRPARRRRVHLGWRNHAHEDRVRRHPARVAGRLRGLQDAWRVRLTRTVASLGRDRRPGRWLGGSHAGARAAVGGARSTAAGRRCHLDTATPLGWWRSVVGTSGGASPVVVDGVAYATSPDGTTTAFDALTRRRALARARGDEAILGSAGRRRGLGGRGRARRARYARSTRRPAMIAGARRWDYPWPRVPPRPPATSVYRRGRHDARGAGPRHRGGPLEPRPGRLPPERARGRGRSHRGDQRRLGLCRRRGHR